MTSESDEAFIKRMAFYDYTSQYREDDVDRLFALARRGAEAAARIEQLEAALREIDETGKFALQVPGPRNCLMEMCETARAALMVGCSPSHRRTLPMSDIVERLRSGAAHRTLVTTGLVNQAADEIERFKASLEDVVIKTQEQADEIARLRDQELEHLGQVGQLSDELERTKREADRAQDAYGVRFLNYLEETARLSDEITRLRAALEWIVGTALTEPQAMVDKARAALEGK